MGDDDDNDGKNDALEWVVRIMNLITILIGLYMVGVSCGLYYARWEHMSFRNWVVNFYSLIFGVLCFASAFDLEIFTRKFGFLQSFLGRAIFYIFIGLYMMSVPSGNLWDICCDDPIESMLPLICSLGLLANGFLFILMLMLPAWSGCCKDGQPDIDEDVSSTSACSEIPWLDYLLRLLSFLVGIFMFFGAYEILKSPPISADSFSTTVGAIYVGIFGLTLILAALEIRKTLTMIGFISRPLGRGLYYLWLSFYVLGVSEPNFDGDFESLLPFFSGVALIGTGIGYIAAFCIIPGKESESDG